MLSLLHRAHACIPCVQGKLVVDGVVASPWALSSYLLNAVPPEVYPYLPAVLDVIAEPIHQLYMQVRCKGARHMLFVWGVEARLHTFLKGVAHLCMDTCRLCSCAGRGPGCGCIPAPDGGGCRRVGHQRQEALNTGLFP
jgi:hypothetical protein